MATADGLRVNTAMTPDEFEAVYRAEHRRLVRLASVLAGSRPIADDCVADVWVACWRRWQVDRPDDPAAYLKRAVVNSLSRTAQRSDRGRSLEATASAGVDGEIRHRVDERLDLADALRTLSFDHRVVIVLRYLEDLTEPQAAALLDVPIGTVKSRTARALQQLERVLGPEYGTTEEVDR